MFVCPAGFMATRVGRTGKKNQGANQVRTYFFDVNNCQVCPQHKPGAKTKTYSVSIKSQEHQERLVFHATQVFQETAKLRYRIEAKNAELKTKHGYQQSWSNNIEAMTLQGAITLFYANMQRIMKLMEKVRGKSPP
ncbi:hypothetical protein FEI15_00765 [Lacticaseibacillus zeae]|uniref:Transposase DDE domain-containing protein n=1 Tax=Lacticaseibacillus zeae TaxID=57037 RepID=A0A5R8LWT4_LACZE|nr:transposase [Lacticaseibacillus zeae]TLF41772.1 hypothetical protein FEI15_00765 [Lacticaseibacillus zeae]